MKDLSTEVKEAIENNLALNPRQIQAQVFANAFQEYLKNKITFLDLQKTVEGICNLEKLQNYKQKVHQFYSVFFLNILQIKANRRQEATDLSTEFAMIPKDLLLIMQGP